MSDAGYASGIEAEARGQEGIGAEARADSRSKALGAVVAGICFVLIFFVAYMLWPHLMRFGILGDRVGTHANAEGNVDWAAVWALVGAVLIAAAIVFAFTRAISLKSIGAFLTDVAGVIGAGRTQEVKPEAISRTTAGSVDARRRTQG